MIECWNGRRAAFLNAQRLGVGLIGLLATTQACGYEQSTHAAFTREAYLRASIGVPNSALLSHLGLPSEQGNSLGNVYIDIAPTATVARLASPPDAPNFSSGMIRRLNDQSPSITPTIESPAGWMMLGAIREDDVPIDDGALENNPQDEPGGVFIRVANHFFDPYFNSSLTVAPLGKRATDWALATPPGGSANHFNIGAAREAMWRAITLKQIDSSGVLSDVPFPSGFAVLGSPGAEDRYHQELRTAYWATMFRALGDVLHLLQDMSQPQHTRDDAHAGLGCIPGLGCILGHSSFYEKYIDARAIGSTTFRLRERYFLSMRMDDVDTRSASTPLPYGTYPPPKLMNYSDFFSNGIGPASLSGTGLANYSNRGFYSAGTNIDNGGAIHPAPPIDVRALQTEIIPAGTVTNTEGKVISESGALTIYKGVVQDSLNGELTDSSVRLTSRGAFDQFMNPVGLQHYTLNHYNYDDQARLLIPRAVAYSAGLLDYFFRGQLDISLPSAGAYAVLDNAAPICKDTCGFRTVKLKLKNTTPGETLSNGFFVAVVKFYRNTDYRSDLSGDFGGPNFVEEDARSWYEEILVSEKVDIAAVAGGQMSPNAESEMTFTFDTPIPINATDIFLQVVFRGTLGNESDAVVVATKDISEPNYLAFENDLDYRYAEETDTFTAVTPDPTTQTFGAIAVRLNNATVPLATLPSLGVRGYAQLAFLTDLNAAATEHMVINFGTPGCCSIGPTFTVELPIAAFTSPPGSSSTYSRTRPVGMYRGRFEDYTAHFFQGSPYGYAPCGDGDSRRICTSAGLTTISSANAVPWTINFP